MLDFIRAATHEDIQGKNEKLILNDWSKKCKTNTSEVRQMLDWIQLHKI
jgi:hypothetical protein